MLRHVPCLFLAVAALAACAPRDEPREAVASAQAREATSVTPSSVPIGWIDEPAGDTIVGPQVVLSGWALDEQGVRAVEMRIGARTFAARYGLPRPDVASVKPGFPDGAASGFHLEANVASIFEGSREARHVASIVAINKNGRETLLGRRHLVLPTRDSEWRALYEAQGARPGDVFHIVPGTSAVTLGGAAGLDTAYVGYTSPTVAAGMRVPILYMRTTLGRAHDWRFDPDWDVDRRCGSRRIAEDSLNGAIAHARKHALPVLFTLNGGVWADASCGVPQWDVVDHLELDDRNVQWNQDNQALPDDHLKSLAGAQESPELARMLTYNVYAERVRHYKRRNLQAAARIVAAFARSDPALFVGINLDPDTAHNPFFEEKQWYDYNPGTLRQFRHWLAGTGPYQGRSEAGVPNLSQYRRAQPLTLAEVSALARRKFATWNEVDPPRQFPREGRPFWHDPWTHEWEVFRRHLIDLHYDELSQWLVQTGIPSSRILSSQGFMAPHESAMPFAVRVTSPTKNYDSGGISIEGAIPAHGHLGAVVYGPAMRNAIRMEAADSLFATFHRLDPDWAIVEMNTAVLSEPAQLPPYAHAYEALRDAFNYGARLVSPMAWAGPDGSQAGQPGYVAYMSWRATPLEDAARDFALSHAYVPRGTRLWTFGTPVHASDDGWRIASGGTLAAGQGYVTLTPSADEIVLVSPPQLALGPREVGLLVLGLDDPQRVLEVQLDVRDAQGTWSPAGTAVRDALRIDPAGMLLPIVWPRTVRWGEQVRVTLRLAPPNAMAPLALRHIALYRATPPAAKATVRK